MMPKLKAAEGACNGANRRVDRLRKNTSGIRDYINGQYEHEGKDGEEVGIGGFTAFAQIRENSSAAHPSRSHILKRNPR